MISVSRYSGRSVLHVLSGTEGFRTGPGHGMLRNGITTALFFRPSAHAHLDFRATIGQLNNHIVNFSSTSAADSSGNRALGSAVLVMDGCISLVVVHRRLRNTTHCTSRIASIPVVGTNSKTGRRPSRAVLSLCSVRGARNGLASLGVAVMNSLGCKHAMRSLVMNVSRFGPAFGFVTPGRLHVPSRRGGFYSGRNVGCGRCARFARSVVGRASVLCVAHMRHRHFASLRRCRHMGGICVLGGSVLGGDHRGLHVLRPLPHIGRVTCSISSGPGTCCVRRTHGKLFTHRTVVYRILNVSIRSWRSHFLVFGFRLSVFGCRGLYRRGEGGGYESPL